MRHEKCPLLLELKGLEKKHKTVQACAREMHVTTTEYMEIRKGWKEPRDEFLERLGLGRTKPQYFRIQGTLFNNRLSK